MERPALLNTLHRSTGLPKGDYTIQLPTGKYIGRAEIESEIFAPKPIVVRSTPFVWTVQPIKVKDGLERYNILPGSDAAGHWTAQGDGVYAFAAKVPGQDEASELILQKARAGGYFIKQANETVAGHAKSGAWYVYKQDEFSPVFAGGKGAMMAAPFTFVAQKKTEGTNGIA
ncbi:unnamed protein product [Tilletia controversa]|nr:unnamed protein product [Tilletia controversa]CAD6973303.1 unnamed protein product [Tilletia controversa]CAD6981030.1 unnamed protein product [Tilletia controversa]